MDDRPRRKFSEDRDDRKAFVPQLNEDSASCNKFRPPSSHEHSESERLSQIYGGQALSSAAGRGDNDNDEALSYGIPHLEEYDDIDGTKMPDDTEELESEAKTGAAPMMKFSGFGFATKKDLLENKLDLSASKKPVAPIKMSLGVQV